jgi:hypothetical protein
LALSCVPQVSKPSAKACQACFTSKQRCSWGEDVVAPVVVGSRESVAQGVAPRGRSRGAAGDAQLRAVKAAEDSALAHKRSADELARAAVAAERSALALEGIQSSLREIALSVAHLGQSPKPTQLGIISGAENGPNLVCSPYRPNSVICLFPIEILRSSLWAKIGQN